MEDFFDLYRKDRWPTIFCPGCGIGTVMNCFYRAFSELNLNQDRVVFVSGVGCSSRVPGYIRADSIHTTHGRALAVATGINLANPDLKVIVFTGDGDLGAIGGNHFINASRRNAEMTVFCINNNIYGMTGGQASTTTPYNAFSTTTPYGNKEYPFDLAELAVTAGANFVARWTVRNVKEIIGSMKKALTKKGFSFVEIVSPCPTGFGRRNKMGDPKQMYEWLRVKTVRREKTRLWDLDPVDLNIKGQITVGEFVERDRPSLAEVLRSVKSDAVQV
ncbi:MAG: 2-oxoacid:ferredoxin oxidoreductase subunit beta [Methanomassiliicoccales archaeon]|nr:2-oxoacid:ferredoxin oxidoreductase subunit beta [Methanomassiliicoccales archaeon]